ncbi:hypothetical protein [Nocardia fluminea]|uniref:hypothetical protein n=1 Tax=Nocardia fluminea TaxID=134984 RepID=UPI00364A765B
MPSGKHRVVQMSRTFCASLLTERAISPETGDVDRRPREQSGEVLYEFVVEGLLSARACAAFPELQATHVGEQTRLTGPVDGRAGFRSVLNRLDTMALTPIAITQLFPVT